MIFISICVGSSCHLKGSEKIVELFQRRISEEKLDDEVLLAGSFCLGKCNRVGVTISIGNGMSEDEVTAGVTPEGFDEFWNSHIKPRLEGGNNCGKLPDAEKI